MLQCETVAGLEELCFWSSDYLAPAVCDISWNNYTSMWSIICAYVVWMYEFVPIQKVWHRYPH